MAIDCGFSFSKHGEQQSYDGHVINLSSKGILFTSTDKFEPGTTLQIVLTPSNSTTAPMQAEVVVARVSSNEVLFEVACEIREIKS